MRAPNSRAWPELLLDVLLEGLDDLLRAHAVGVDRVGDVAHHRLDLHPVRLGEQLDQLLAVVLHVVVENSHSPQASLTQRGGRHRNRSPGAPAQAAVGAAARRAPPGARVHRAGVGRALRAAGGRVGADRRRRTHAGGARARGVQEARPDRHARGRRARCGRRGHRGAGHGRAAVDPGTDGLLHRRRLRLRPLPSDAPRRVPRAPGPVRDPRRRAQGARRRGQAAWRRR